MYFFNFLDRNAMINGKLNSLSKDLNLKGTQYNTCVSILFVGYTTIIQFKSYGVVSLTQKSYLLGQVPSNMILNRVRPSWFMSGESRVTKLCSKDHITNLTLGFMLAWSVVSLLTYMAKDFHGMLVCRFILGITEAPVCRIYHSQKGCRLRLTLTSSTRVPCT